MLFCCGDRSHAVLKQAGQAKFTLQDISERNIFPFGHLTRARKRQYQAFTYIDHAGMPNSNPLPGILPRSGIIDCFVDLLYGSRKNKIASVLHSGFRLMLVDQSASDICDYYSRIERSQVYSDNEAGIVAKAQRNRFSSHSTRVVTGFHNQPSIHQILDDSGDGSCTEAGLLGQLNARNVALRVNELQNSPLALESLGFGISRLLPFWTPRVHLLCPFMAVCSPRLYDPEALWTVPVAET